MSFPCVGIDGAGLALKCLQVPFCANNVYDLEGRYQQHLEKHLPDCDLHLGSIDGDICQADLGSIERPVDLLISGPPCPPWAGNGCHKGQEDSRADVFLSVMKMVLVLIKSGDLKACVLENVKGIMHQRNGATSFMENITAFLRHECPEFDWGVVSLKAEQYMLAQQRTRVFLRGLRRTVGKGTVPEPLDPFGKKPLVDFLDPKLPSVDKSTLTDVTRQNLIDAMAAINKMMKKGDAVSSDIIVFPLDRAEGKVYVRRFSKNIVPTLTTTNMFLASLDLEMPEKDRKFFRFLSLTERMLLQGFDADTLYDCSDALRIKGAGNTYPVPLIIAVVAPLLMEIRPNLGAVPRSSTSLGAQDCAKFDEFMEACKADSMRALARGIAKKRPAAVKTQAKKKSSQQSESQSKNESSKCQEKGSKSKSKGNHKGWDKKIHRAPFAESIPLDWIVILLIMAAAWALLAESSPKGWRAENMFVSCAGILIIV